MSGFNVQKCEMAAVDFKDLDPFSCPICLDPLENPVTIPCGHNYCMACIEDYWNGNEEKHSESYSCPECRETFTPRPALNKNTMFAEMVEQLKKAKLQDSSPENPGPARPAVKFCQECVKSHGENHQFKHEKENPGEKPTIIVINRLPRMDICLLHNYPLEIYCRTDRQLICSLCFTKSHRDHDAVSVAPISTERQEHKSSHTNTHHGNRHTSHKHERTEHNRSRHRHGSRHRSSSRNILHLKSGHGGHHESHGSSTIVHGHVGGGGHLKTTHRSRHGEWNMSSRHERSQH